MLGIDFFRQALDFQKKYLRGNRSKIHCKPMERLSMKSGAFSLQGTISWLA